MTHSTAHRVALFTLLMTWLFALASCTSGPASSPRPITGIYGPTYLWVTRWDYQTQADVEKAIDDAAWLGVTDVIWQVRGQCDAFYKSDLEPWGEELVAAAGGVPRFDPLEVAVDRAHRNGLRIHAWMNAMPMWKGKSPPKDPRHVYHTNPEWRLYDQQGQPQALNDHYVIVNPVLPEVQRHIVNVVRDILSRYDVDGIHLDYIRFVSDTMQDASQYPGDPRSMSMYRQWLANTSGEDGTMLPDFIREQITNLVREIDGVTSRRGKMLTCAIWRRPDLAVNNYMQDAGKWLNDGTIDYGMPMIYTEDNARFISDVAAWKNVAPSYRIVPGLGNYKHTPPQTVEQMDLSRGMGGVALFAYASLFENGNPKEDKSLPAQLARKERRESVRAALWEGMRR